MARTILKDLLSSKSTIILDGAMGTELQRRDVDTGLPLWSANALMVHPEVVLQIHKDYIEAGADIITTNTFRTTRRTFRRANLPDRSLQFTKSAVALARKARDEFPDRHRLKIVTGQTLFRKTLTSLQNIRRLLSVLRVKVSTSFFLRR
ncbi:MAG: homocysteine S-methyltransferase [Bacteroidetes bacterium]|nr:homocysteine S-methyltransferase [Bacteroidota bacterium]